MINMPAISVHSFSKLGLGSGNSKILKLAGPVAAAIISGIVLIFVIWPTVNKVINLNISNKQQAKRAESLEAKVQTLSNLDRDLLDRQLTATEQLLPSDKGVFPFVQQVERQASASGVILDKIDVAPGAVGDSFSLGQKSGSTTNQPNAVATPGQSAADLGVNVDTPKIQLRVAITGDYQSFLRFVGGLLDSPRIISIHDLTVASSRGENASSAVRTLLSIDAFWMPLIRELPPVEAPISLLSEEEAQLLSSVKPPQPEISGGIGAPAGSGTPAVPTGKSDLFAPY